MWLAVIFTRKYFKFGLNTTGPSQSHFRNFLVCSIKRVNSQSETLHQPQMTYVIIMDPGLFPVVDEYELTKRDFRQYAKMVSVQ